MWHFCERWRVKLSKKDQLVEYAVQDIISELPFSVRSQYRTDKECAMDFIEAYLAGKQC